ncbi:MAG: sugar phosphate isomerase/epimerase family protein [Verrucomicrobiales bacterium]
MNNHHKIKVGCFALIDPFCPLDHQLKRIADMGFHCADITDSHSGGLLSSGIFHAAVSLDDNPFDVKRQFDKYGLEISSMAAHAHLLDPSTPARYGNTEIMKAVKLAATIDVKYIVTTELEPETEWGKNLSYEHQVIIVAEKLHEPLRLAQDLGVKILLEPHGPLTGSIQGIRDIMAALDNPPALGVNLDTGNSWLGGADPVAMAREFKDLIGHIHWKDLGAEMEEKRGTMHGCGFSTIALGEGVIDIAGVCEVLKDAGIEASTFEILGEENLKKSHKFLKQQGIA